MISQFRQGSQCSSKVAFLCSCSAGQSDQTRFLGKSLPLQLQIAESRSCLHASSLNVGTIYIFGAPREEKLAQARFLGESPKRAREAIILPIFEVQVALVPPEVLRYETSGSPRNGSGLKCSQKWSRDPERKRLQNSTKNGGTDYLQYVSQRLQVPNVQALWPQTPFPELYGYSDPLGHSFILCLPDSKLQLLFEERALRPSAQNAGNSRRPLQGPNQ